MRIKPNEIRAGQLLIIKNRYQSYRVLGKVKETPKTITFNVNYYTDDCRGIGDFITKDVTFRKTTIVESREDCIGTDFDQLHRIKPERLKDIIDRGFELYIVTKKQIYDGFDNGLRVGHYMFAWFNGVNWETENILDDGIVNCHPPSMNSDKPQLSGWNNSEGGFEDFYKKVSMNIILK